MAINIKTFFDQDTATFTYIVSGKNTNKAVIIDPVLNYDQYSGKVHTNSADEVIRYIKQDSLSLEWLLETHIHADHITASHYLKNKLGGRLGISIKIKDVLGYWIPIFNTSKDTKLDGSQFDKLFNDNEIIKLGNIDIKVLHTPGHTPACSSYLIEDTIFVGDTIFMPDIGTARTDFPGGRADIMYDSVQRILSLPDETRILCAMIIHYQGEKLVVCQPLKNKKRKIFLYMKEFQKMNLYKHVINEIKAKPSLKCYYLLYKLI